MDAELAQQLQLAVKGDLSAYGYVVAAFQPLVCGIARRYLRDAHAVEDATQETFLRAWRGLSEVRDLGAFPGWLAAVARTQAMRVLRRPTPDLIEADATEPAAPDPAQKAETVHAVHRAISGLSEAHKGVIERHYLEGRSLEEIAALLDLPLGTVKRRLFEARAQLRARLAGFDPSAEQARSGKHRFPL